MMEDMVKRCQIPAFGDWEYCDELPITQYFECAMQAGLIRGHYSGEDADLFKPPPPVAPPVIKPHYHPRQRKARREGKGEKYYEKEQHIRKQGKVCDVTAQATAVATPRRPRSPKAVDEDLYKIPPDLLYQKPKRKRLLGNFWKSCLGLSCIS